MADEAAEDEGLPLTNFQKHGAARALRLIRDTGGAIVADEVGLGKTFIAGEILKLYLDRRQRCLLVCPAQLRDTTWRKFLSQFMLKNVECVSYEQLAIDAQIGLAEPHLRKEVLERPLDEYQLVVVDEAHNYRNPDAPTRAQALRTLLYGAPRDLLLLTATPVNNSLWDLYHLIRYYIRQDSFLADRGILSIRDRFTQASREDPAALSPDLLYPIIDATTVKRTRQFVKKHYGGDTIRLPDGTDATIVFPAPRAITVTYPLLDPFPALFDKLERALDPNGAEGALTFARYHPVAYRSRVDDDDADVDARAAAAMGLLRSGLLKRFESSIHAFRLTLDRIIAEHATFLDLLDKGWIASTAVLKSLPDADDEDLEALLGEEDGLIPAEGHDVTALRAAVAGDAKILRDLCEDLRRVTPDGDPKLAALVAELEAIASDAKGEAIDEFHAGQLRKVIVFSFFADTVRYLREELGRLIGSRPSLASYRDRVVAVAGSSDVEVAEVSRLAAVAGFAPISMQVTPPDDRYDLLIATDVLAEGVNLQQCRHIINYDVPWNPMRLVQRHGRVDRIGSPHPRVFLRTVFPADRLDQLLNLEARILDKIALAAASVGVVSPVQGGAGGGQVFAETREEIERLLAGDASLFERGAARGGQSGEEYRQTLRKGMDGLSDRIARMPAGVGSGLLRGEQSGVFFCAAIANRTYLRFISTDVAWQPLPGLEPIREVGTCLRIIECDEAAERHVPPLLGDSVFDLWPIALADIYASWMRETDPANLQPRVRPLNRRVAEFIRSNSPAGLGGRVVEQALDILEAPWPYREEMLLRGWFADDSVSETVKARELVEKINASGLLPYVQPPILPLIELEDIQLICWLGIEASVPGTR